MDITEQLNRQFSIDNYVTFSYGSGNLPIIKVTTRKATATVSLLGGQVLSYQPITNEHDLLFLSNNAYFQEGKAIKGGSPICWPWFAAKPDDDSLPFHGLVRNQFWQVESTNHLDNGDIIIVLLYKNTVQTERLWPYSFELREVITISDKLAIQLSTTNTDNQTFNITQAIHTYFNVGDITKVEVTGLENNKYLDKVDNFSEKNQSGIVTVEQEVDRIYQDVDKPLAIKDKALNRTIHIHYSGSSTCVVWNPWQDISRASNDLEDNDYQRFICVETANAADEIIEIQPGKTYQLGVEYTINYFNE